MSALQLPKPDHGDVFAIIIETDHEQYLFLFDDDSKEECLKRASKFARDPNLNFTWCDAVSVAKNMRAIGEQIS